MPNLHGKTLGSALSAAGLRLGAQRSVVDTACEAIGTVLGQTPAAGTRVAAGSAVGVSIGQRPTHPCP